MKKLTLLSLAVLSLSAINSNTVLAADSKNYNGSSCIAFGGDGKRLNYSNIYNTSSSQILRVDCVGTKDAKNIKNAWMEVKDLSSSEDISCTLTSHYNVVGQSGGRVWNQNRRTSGINSNWQKLSYTSLGAAGNGHYYFGCSVPKRTSNGASWIGTYNINENT